MKLRVTDFSNNKISLVPADYEHTQTEQIFVHVISVKCL